jgi:hypothetical protein
MHHPVLVCVIFIYITAVSFASINVLRHFSIHSLARAAESEASVVWVNEVRR